jgi:hypothetical protein
MESADGELSSVDRSRAQRKAVIRYLPLTALTGILLSAAYWYGAASSRQVPRGAAVSMKLSEPGNGQSILITNADVVATVAKTLRSGHIIHRHCDCAVSGGFEVRFADGQTLPVDYTLGHDEVRFDIGMAKHLYSVPLGEFLRAMKQLGIRVPGLPWDYAEDGIPKWPTNTMSP